MNRADNQRGRDTQARIESAFLVLLAQKEPNKITIREICDGAQISRTAFYKHYEDIYDLLRKVGQKFMMQSRAFFTDGTQQGENYTRQAYLQYFDFISQNRTFFLYFFRQGVPLHVTFSSLKDKPGKPLVQRQYRNIFYSGALNALTLYWLEGGCRESPEELIHIIESLYRTTFWEE